MVSNSNTSRAPYASGLCHTESLKTILFLTLQVKTKKPKKQTNKNHTHTHTQTENLCQQKQLSTITQLAGGRGGISTQAICLQSSFTHTCNQQVLNIGCVPGTVPGPGGVGCLMENGLWVRTPMFFTTAHTGSH